MTPSRLKTNLAILVLGDAAGKLINVFVFSRLGQILQPAGYGQLEFVLAAILVGTLFIEAGLGPFGARLVARDPASASRVLGSIVALRAKILVFVLVLLGLFASASSVEGNARMWLLLSAGLILIPKPFLCEWLFQGRSEMATVTATMLIEPAISLLGTLLFVHEPAHVARVPFILAAATGSVALAQQAIAAVRGVRPDVRHGLENSGALLRESLPLGLSTVAWAVRFFSPVLALGWFAGGEAVGTFGAAHRLTVSAHAIVWLYFFNLLPVWSRLGHDDRLLRESVRTSFVLTLGLASLLLGGIFFAAPLLVARELYGAEYGRSVDLLRVLALVPAFAWISGNFRFGLIAKGDLRSELKASLGGAAFAVVVFAILRSRIDPWSAAFTFCAAECVTLVIAAWMWRRGRVPTGAVHPTTTGESAAGMPR